MEKLDKMIEVAKTGRSKCRGCKELIAQDDLRFGEEVISRFGDGGDIATMWYHLDCAVEKRPVQLKEALAKLKAKFPGRTELEKKLATAKAPKGRGGEAKGTYPYAEISPTGRSKCLKCEKAVEKDAVRIAVEREVEIQGVMRMSPGYLHVPCAAKFIGDKKLAAKLKANSKIPAAQLTAALKQL